MTDPGQDRCHVMDNQSCWHGGTVDHDDRQAEHPRGIQFGPRAAAAGVLGDNQLDATGFQQFQIIGLGKGAARDDMLGPRQGHRADRRIDKPQQILMPGLGGEGRQILPSNCQKDAGRLLGKRRNGGGYVGDMGPGIGLVWRPGRAFKGAKRNVGQLGGGDGITAHSRGKGMGCVDQMRDVFEAKIIGKPGNAAKAADPRRQGLLHRIVGASGIGKNRVEPLGCQLAGQGRGFGRAAQKKDSCHG